MSIAQSTMETRVGLVMCRPFNWTWPGSAARHLHCVDAERTVGDIGAPTSMVRNGQGGGRLMIQGLLRGVVDAGLARVIPYAVFAAASAYVEAQWGVCQGRYSMKAVGHSCAWQHLHHRLASVIDSAFISGNEACICCISFAMLHTTKPRLHQLHGLHGQCN